MKYILLVFVGGGLGAVLRYLIAQAPGNLYLPLPTFVANMLGCFLIGISMPFFLAKAGTTELRLLVVTGFLGGLTTFSTFTYETIQLFENTTEVLALVNIFGNVICGLALAMLGMWIARTMMV